MRKIIFFILITIVIFTSCKNQSSEKNTLTKTNTITVAYYFDQTGRDDILSGGIKMIPIKTRAGEFNVWTKRIGNNPKIKVLILHGGPGASHVYLECFDSFFPGAGIEYYY